MQALHTVFSYNIMGAFLLFVFVFASQVIGGFNTKLPPPSYGNSISILSIDGGGFQGIIPAVVLHHLEKALQIVSKDEDAALADYFDVIAGASTGGLITAMLAAPNPNEPSRPLLSTSDVLQFYLDYGPSIFNDSSKSARVWNALPHLASLILPFPKYDGEFLHSKARELMRENRLHDALTNVVIPSFDIKKVHPVIFSSFKVKKVPSLDAKLSDIAIGTSAASNILPPYYFENGGDEFNLIDGAIVASNSALLAVNEVIQQLEEKNSDFISVKENEPTKILLLSVGCGIKNGESKAIDAKTATNDIGIFWINRTLTSIYGSVEDINGYHLHSIFPNIQSSKNYYLRIQEYDLDPSIDGNNVTKENLEKVVKAGEKLLEETVKVMDVTTFIPQEKPSEGTNAQALERLAKVLYKEKQLRLKTKSMEKGKRPFVEAITSPLHMSGMV